MIALKLDTSFDTATPWLVRIHRAMTGDRTEFHGYVARRASERSRLHVRTLAPSRHATADGLGAKRTGHLERAAGSIEPDQDAQAAYLVFPRNFGLQRAFHPIDIRPGPGKQWLTIPATAETYGRRAGEFGKLFFKMVGGRYPALMFARSRRRAGPSPSHGGASIPVGCIRPPGSRMIAWTSSWRDTTHVPPSRSRREFTVAFWLARSVHQDQDRSLMPSDEEFALDAEAAALEFIRDLETEGGAA